MLITNDSQELSFAVNSLNTSFESYSEPQEQAQEGVKDFSIKPALPNQKSIDRAISELHALNLSDYELIKIAIATGKNTAYLLHKNIKQLCNVFCLSQQLATLSDSEAQELERQYTKQLDILSFRQGKHCKVTKRKATYIDRFLKVTASQHQAAIDANQLIVLTAGMGTGKTKDFIKPFCKQAKTRGLQSIAIAHLVSLIDELAKVIDLSDDPQNPIPLTNYQSIKLDENVNIPFGIACCINSITNDSIATTIRKMLGNFVLVIDEHAQLMKNFAAQTFSTDANKKTSSYACLSALIELIKTAKAVVIADADMTDYEVDVIAKLRKQEPVILTSKRDRRYIKSTFISDSSKKGQGVSDAFLRIVDITKAGEKALFCSDSIDVCKNIHALIELHAPNIRTLMITGDKTVNSSPAVRAFLKNIIVEAKKYDLIIISPSITSGVSIECNPEYTTCISYYTGATITHTAADQQKLRIRDVKRMITYVVCKKREAHTVVLDSEQAASTLKVHHTGTHTMLDNLLSHSKQLAEDSRANFLQYSVIKQIEAGYQVSFEMIDSAMDYGVSEIKAERKEEYKQSILDAQRLTTAQHNELKELDFIDSEQAILSDAYELADALALPPARQIDDQIFDAYAGGRGVRPMRRGSIILGYTNKDDIQAIEDSRYTPVSRRIYPNIIHDLGNKLLEAVFNKKITSIELALDSLTFCNSQLKKAKEFIQDNAVIGAGAGLFPSSVVDRKYTKIKNRVRASVIYEPREISDRYVSKIITEILERIGLKTEAAGRNQVREGNTRKNESIYKINEDSARLLIELGTYQKQKSDEIKAKQAEREKAKADKKAYFEAVEAQELARIKAHAEYIVLSHMELRNGNIDADKLTEEAERQGISKEILLMAIEQLIIAKE